MNDSPIILFSGSSHPELAQKIATYLDIRLGDALVSTFSDGETRVELRENVRGADIYIIQSIGFPANHHIMEALIIADACRRASANKITLVTPYFGYARQERKNISRTPITAKLVADLIETAGIDRLVATELHTGAIQGFFTVPVDHLFVKPVFLEYLSGTLNIEDNNIVVVSPDAGGVPRARAYAKYLGNSLVVMDKRRSQPNKSAILNVIGDVDGKHCYIVDDIIDTAGTLNNVCEALLDRGALSVRAAIAHPVLSGPAIERINTSKLTELIVSDSLVLTEEAQKSAKIKTLSICGLIGEAIKRIHSQLSVSALFID
ncbi:MAG: ribose-phosphate pyrophosphokinase [Proteobacteria bacterium]|nr:ribose-phosphate pyrophosphokinase [Pseudomonadota bacterium]